MNYVVGTDLAHMTGTSLVAAKQHRAFGHVDLKLAGLMIVGTMIGVECGARLVEYLERLGGATIDLVIGGSYVVILLSLSGFMGYESLRALRKSAAPDEAVPTADAVEHGGLAARAPRVAGRTWDADVPRPHANREGHPEPRPRPQAVRPMRRTPSLASPGSPPKLTW